MNTLSVHKFLKLLITLVTISKNNITATNYITMMNKTFGQDKTKLTSDWKIKKLVIEV